MNYEDWYAGAPAAPVKWYYVSHSTQIEYIKVSRKQKILRGPKSQEVTHIASLPNHNKLNVASFPFKSNTTNTAKTELRAVWKKEKRGWMHLVE